MDTSPAAHTPLPKLTKMIYGAGDTGLASWGTLRQIFCAIFLTDAVAIFFSLQVLGWFGYQSPPQGAATFQQPLAAVQAIRILTGPFGALLLFSSVILAWFYPLTRAKHDRIRTLLSRRHTRVEVES